MSITRYLKASGVTLPFSFASHENDSRLQELEGKLFKLMRDCEDLTSIKAVSDKVSDFFESEAIKLLVDSEKKGASAKKTANDEPIETSTVFDTFCRDYYSLNGSDFYSQEHPALTYTMGEDDPCLCSYPQLDTEPNDITTVAKQYMVLKQYQRKQIEATEVLQAMIEKTADSYDCRCVGVASSCGAVKYTYQLIPTTQKEGPQSGTIPSLHIECTYDKGKQLWHVGVSPTARMEEAQHLDAFFRAQLPPSNRISSDIRISALHQLKAKKLVKPQQYNWVVAIAVGVIAVASITVLAYACPPVALWLASIAASNALAIVESAALSVGVVSPGVIAGFMCANKNYTKEKACIEEATLSESAITRLKHTADDTADGYTPEALRNEFFKKPSNAAFRREVERDERLYEKLLLPKGSDAISQKISKQVLRYCQEKIERNDRKKLSELKGSSLFETVVAQALKTHCQTLVDQKDRPGIGRLCNDPMFSDSMKAVLTELLEGQPGELSTLMGAESTACMALKILIVEPASEEPVNVRDLLAIIKSGDDFAGTISPKMRAWRVSALNPPMKNIAIDYIKNELARYSRCLKEDQSSKLNPTIKLLLENGEVRQEIVKDTELMGSLSSQHKTDQFDSSAQGLVAFYEWNNTPEVASEINSDHGEFNPELFNREFNQIAHSLTIRVDNGESGFTEIDLSVFKSKLAQCQAEIVNLKDSQPYYVGRDSKEALDVFLTTIGPQIGLPETEFQQQNQFLANLFQLMSDLSTRVTVATIGSLAINFESYRKISITYDASKACWSVLENIARPGNPLDGGGYGFKVISPQSLDHLEMQLSQDNSKNILQGCSTSILSMKDGNIKTSYSLSFDGAFPLSMIPSYKKEAAKHATTYQENQSVEPLAAVAENTVGLFSESPGAPLLGPDAPTSLQEKAAEFTPPL